MQDRHLCWTPYFFLGPAVTHHFLDLETLLLISRMLFSELYNIMVKKVTFLGRWRSDRPPGSVLLGC